MNILEQTFHNIQQAAGNVGNAVLRTVVPGGANLSNIANTPQLQQRINTNVQNVSNAVTRNPIVQSVAQTRIPIPFIPPTFTPYVPTIGQLTQGRIVNPAVNAYQGAVGAFDQSKSISDRAKSAVGAGFNAAQFTPGMMAANLGGFGVYEGAKAGIQAARTGGNVGQEFAKGYSGNNSVGVGSALSSNPMIAGALNIGELPAMMLEGKARGVVKGKLLTTALKDVSPNAFNIHPEDQALLKDVIGRFQARQKVHPEDLKDLQNLAEHYLGSKFRTAPTKKIMDAFDYVLASQNGGIHTTRFPKMGIANEPGAPVLGARQTPIEAPSPLQGGNLPPLQTNIPPLSSETSILTGQEGNSLRNIVTQPPGTTILKDKKLVLRMKGSEKLSPELRQTLEGTYVPQSNADTIRVAKQLVFKDPKAAELRALSPQNAVDQAIGAELFGYHMVHGNVAKANQIINATSGTNEGQMIQILSQYDKTTPAGAVKFAQSTINEYNKNNPNNPLNLSNETVKSLFDAATKIQNMPVGRERNIASHQLMEQVNALIPSTFVDKAITLWKAGLLTSLRTQERNALGNAVHGAVEMVKDVPGALADQAMSLATGKRTLTATGQGIGSGARQGLTAAKDIMTTGFDPEQAISKYNQKQITWKNTPLQQVAKKYTDLVFRSMSASDKPFYNAALKRSLYDQAGAEAINAGKRGDQAFIENLVQNPTDQMVKNSIQDADTATFKNKNTFSEIANAAKRQLGKNEATKLFGEVVAPFTGVPSAIAGQMLAYSPAGLAKGIFNAGKVVTQDVPNLQRQAAQEIGRGVIGTGILGLGAYLTSKGLISGQPKDATESKQWELEGKKPNSIFIGGQWRSINSIGPEAIVALAGSKFQQEASKGADASLGNLGASLGKDFLNQTFLAGVQGPINAITDPARYGQSYLKSMAGSLVPNIVKDAARAGDTSQRQTNTVGDSIAYGIPGLRNNLLPKQDVLGNTIPNEQQGAAAFTDVFNSTTPINNPVVDELARLNNVGNNATPSTLGKKQTILGQKVDLTPEELTQLNANSGQIVQQQLNALIQSPNYQSLTDEAKAKAIDTIVSDARTKYKNLSASGQLPANSFLKSNGQLQTVDTTPIQAPKLTGDPNLDNKLMANYRSAIAARNNQMAQLSQAGGTGMAKDLTSQNTYTYVDKTGTLQRVDLSPVQAPTLTNDPILNKSLISSYKTALSTQASNVVKLYQEGQISQQEASSRLASLQAAKGPAKGRKGKKLKVKKVRLSSGKPIKFKVPKLPKLSQTKDKKTKSLKTSTFPVLKIKKT